MSAEIAVRNLCKAFSRANVDELLDFFAEGAVYHKIPIARFVGKEAIRCTLSEFFGPGVSVEFEMLNLAVEGNAVLTERVVHFTTGGKKISLPVMGIFEVTERGKISAWRDYFDKGQAGLV